LCERVITQLESLNRAHSFDLSSQDIAADPELYERYRNIIPVVAVDGKVRLAGAALSNPRTLESKLRRALST